jgi:hypothetical protein
MAAQQTAEERERQQARHDDRADAQDVRAARVRAGDEQEGGKRAHVHRRELLALEPLAVLVIAGQDDRHRSCPP